LLSLWPHRLLHSVPTLLPTNRWRARHLPCWRPCAPGPRQYGTWDSCLSLIFAFFINAAILILAAAAFHYGASANPDIAGLADAYELLAPALGSTAARVLFGVALLACGQNSSITGTLAGQVRSILMYL